MIFKCGLTWEEVQKRRGEWHDFFAFVPHVVFIADGIAHCAWLETIQRRSTYVSDINVSAYWKNEYRLKVRD